MSTQDKALLIARGKRLRRLRKLAGLTRDELAARADVSRASMSYWENATYSGLSYKAAEKVIPVIKAEGIFCSVEWLLLGIGQDPYQTSGGATEGKKGSSQVIQQEIEFFTSLNPHAVVMQLQHDGMAPFFAQGDYIGGIWQKADAVRKIDPEANYIVQIGNLSQVRRLKRDTRTGLYDVSYLNPVKGKNEQFESHGVRLESIAPVIRVWK
jgi:transcriptional regulator with XRE-family HTH domain